MKFGIRNSEFGLNVKILSCIALLLVACTDYVDEYKGDYEDAYGNEETFRKNLNKLDWEGLSSCDEGDWVWCAVKDGEYKSETSNGSHWEQSIDGSAKLVFAGKDSRAYYFTTDRLTEDLSSFIRLNGGISFKLEKAEGSFEAGLQVKVENAIIADNDRVVFVFGNEYSSAKLCLRSVEGSNDVKSEWCWALDRNIPVSAQTFNYKDLKHVKGTKDLSQFVEEANVLAVMLTAGGDVKTGLTVAAFGFDGEPFVKESDEPDDSSSSTAESSSCIEGNSTAATSSSTTESHSSMTENSSSSIPSSSVASSSSEESSDSMNGFVWKGHLNSDVVKTNVGSGSKWYEYTDQINDGTTVIQRPEGNMYEVCHGNCVMVWYGNGSAFIYAGIGFGLDQSGVTFDVTDWKGLCIAYMSDRALILRLDPESSSDYPGSIPQVVLDSVPEDSSFVMRRFLWSEFSKGYGGVSAMQIVKKLKGVNVAFEGAPAGTSQFFNILQIGSYDNCGDVVAGSVDKSKFSSSSTQSSSSSFVESSSDIEIDSTDCQKNDLWCRNTSYRVNTGIDAGLENGGYWWAKTDVSEPSPGASKLNWTPALGADSSFNSVIDHCNGLCGSFEWNKGSMLYDPWVEIGFSIAGMAEPSSGNIPIDVSNWGGLCFTYTSSKAPTLVLHFETEIEEYLKYDLPKKSIPIKNNPGEQCVAWSDFNQSRLKDSLKISGEEAAKYVTDIGFKIAGSDGSAGDFNIIRITKKNNTGDAKMSTWSYLNPDRSYALIRDSRDGHFYKTIKIGEQTWMAQNLNYVPSDDNAGSCLAGDSANCNIYGRLYTWKVAKEVCPDGWYLPSRSDVITLLEKVSGGNKLKSSRGWCSGCNGTDDYGFSALPNLGEGGLSAMFHTIQEVHGSEGEVYGGNLTIYEDDQAIVGHDDTSQVYPVRCIKGPVSGTMTDGRDGKTYKTVRIGNQVWMAENLNYAYTEKTADLDSSSFCHLDDGTGDRGAANCAKYGRYYLWSAAMDSAGIISSNGAGCGFGSTCSPSSRVRGVCPEGWHLPKKEEFESLITSVGGATEGGKKLKSTESGGIPGTDDFGFSAILTGEYYNGFGNEGLARYWSSSDENSETSAYFMLLNTYDPKVELKNIPYTKEYGFSVRCIED